MKQLSLNKIVALLMFFSITSSVISQELLTKDQAIKLALENNFGIKLANNQVAIADNNANILNAGYLPTLTGNAGADFDRTSTNTTFGPDQNGNIRPDLVIDGAETNRLNASINLNYTLFDGLGRRYNYKELQERYNLTDLQARETIENTMLQLFSVYFEVARLTENVSLLKRSLQITKDRVKRAQYQFEFGQVNKLQILNAQVDVTTDSTSLLNARQSLRNAQRDLNVVMNQDIETLIEVDTTVTFNNLLSIQKHINNALQNNVRVLQSEKDITISNYQIKRARALFLPTIGLTGSYGFNRADNPTTTFFPGNVQNRTPLTAGLNLRWNLFDGGRAITGIKNAKIVKSNQELAKEQVKQQVSRDIANAKGDYENALLILDLQTQNLITTEDNFNRSQERLKLSQITSIEFRQAQLNLLNAQFSKNAAKYTAKIAELLVLQLSGALLNTTF